ncbi:MAG: hypothetical protein A3D16_00185 [Rhodobacterales bacterium RIFCSPHIGHO2_02_FULL_62_130]|nr:MAG: hypothetical protein A3D16_00185 [Rhodobacterales bacterium RIFCSPHIGHO2_02_FULL_62_130]OHC58538.1 MAG: hypothetical protein A3E48_01135 [Rhodobacterales bacterium RIFCSPHIGHO2_12_FULL_62_75]HCY98935.1 hypothetical protein [Rhodobacter sp.]
MRRKGQACQPDEGSVIPPTFGAAFGGFALRQKDARPGRGVQRSGEVPFGKGRAIFPRRDSACGKEGQSLRMASVAQGLRIVELS